MEPDTRISVLPKLPFDKLVGVLCGITFFRRGSALLTCAVQYIHGPNKGFVMEGGSVGTDVVR